MGRNSCRDALERGCQSERSTGGATQATVGATLCALTGLTAAVATAATIRSGELTTRHLVPRAGRVNSSRSYFTETASSRRRLVGQHSIFVQFPHCRGSLICD